MQSLNSDSTSKNNLGKENHRDSVSEVSFRLQSLQNVFLQDQNTCRKWIKQNLGQYLKMTPSGTPC